MQTSTRLQKFHSRANSTANSSFQMGYHRNKDYLKTSSKISDDLSTTDAELKLLKRQGCKYSFSIWHTPNCLRAEMRFLCYHPLFQVTSCHSQLSHWNPSRTFPSSPFQGSVCCLYSFSLPFAETREFFVSSWQTYTEVLHLPRPSIISMTVTSAVHRVLVRLLKQSSSLLPSPCSGCLETAGLWPICC